MIKNGQEYERRFALLAIVVVCFMTMVGFASWDTVPQPKPAQDIIDVLVPVPTPTLNQFGHTERTRVIFNIAKILETCQNYETRIKALEKQVAELTKPVIDPNEVKKLKE